MSLFTPAMEAELAKPFATVFGAVEIVLPAHTIRLLDGAGSLTFGGHTFTGQDDTFGVLSAIDSFSDGIGDEAPALNITLAPAGDAAAATLSSATMQGSPVTVWLGAVDRATGIVIADPLTIFVGELDQPILTADKGTRELEYECVSGFERLFSDDEGARLSDSHHKMVWPGETGLANVSSVTKTIYWGLDRPAGSIVAATSGTFVGGVAQAFQQRQMIP
jgi:hypothetical protein